MRPGGGRSSWSSSPTRGPSHPPAHRSQVPPARGTVPGPPAAPHADARSTTATDDRAGGRSGGMAAGDHGMMTADMDRLLTAPGRRPADDDAAPHPGGPPTAVTPPAVAPPAAPDGGAPDHRPFRRLAAAVLVGALTMFGVATLDSFAGATVPVLGSFASLPAPGRARAGGGAAAARHAGHLPDLEPAGRRRHRRRRLLGPAPVRAGRLRAAHRPGGGARRPALASARRRAVHRRSCSTTSTAGSTPTAATASGRSSRRPPSGPRATASCAAGCRARPARARSTRSTGAWPSPTSRRCTSPAPAWPSTGAPSVTRSSARGRTPSRRSASSTWPDASPRPSRRSATRTGSCSRSAGGSPPSTRAAQR